MSDKPYIEAKLIDLANLLLIERDYVLSDVAADGADTIFRLRAEVEQWKQSHSDACDLAERHMEEKNRLRALNAELVEALDKLLWKCAYIDEHGGLQSRFKDTDGLITAAVRARGAIAKAESEGA